MSRRSVNTFAAVRGAALVTSAGLLVVVPLWMVVVNSFKTQSDAAALSLGWPSEWAAGSNYRDVIEQSRFIRSFVNSVIVTGVSVSALLMLGAPAAWFFARSPSRASTRIYWLCLLGVLLPLPVVPLVYLLREVGLQGTQFGLIVFTVGSRISLVMFILTGFVRGIPLELEHAAATDGAGRRVIFMRVVLPLMKPALSTAFIILAVLIWNDFFGPLFLLAREDQNTLPLGLYRLSSGVSQATAWNYVFSHVVLVSLPLIVVYAIAQRRIVEGMTAGAIRG